KNVFAALYGHKYTKAEYIRLAPHLLIDKNNFLIKRPKEITLFEDSKYKKINLVWYPKEIDELWSISQTIAFGDEPLIGYEFINNGVWIGLPSFDPSEEQQKSFIEILKNLKKFRDYPFIVFDVRGNGGGSTDWQRPILRNLYGDFFIKTLGVNHHYNHDWVKKIRMTPENYNDLQKHMTENEKKSFLSDLEYNRTHHIEKWNIFDEKENLFSHQDEVKKFPKIYLLTDGRCSSTCWLFVREMLQMPNVVQIGEETNTQSLYSQSRTINLPSGFGKLIFPMQERVFPIDHINQSFIPHIKYLGDWNDTEKLKKFVLDIAKH
ncbi:MAG: S41 family peptidase, partial [Alphaproteobacteria bacterium]|nr:S41 family peptidase [Alphaproteobacteria bacterium]